MREEHDVPLADLTTMRVGGPAARLVIATTTDEVVDAVREVDDADEPLLVISGGSNVVVTDAGFPGTVVRVASDGIEVESSDLCGGVMVRVAAGVPWDDLVARAVVEGWSGIEALSGIPGSARVRPRCRTSAPTARRSPRPSPRCGSGTVTSSACARSPRSSAPSPTATRSSRPPTGSSSSTCCSSSSPPS